MDADEHTALALLSQKDCLFFRDYAERMVFARLVMMGYARCYVKEDRSEWVRIATAEEQGLAMKYSAQEGNWAVKA